MTSSVRQARICSWLLRRKPSKYVSTTALRDDTYYSPVSAGGTLSTSSAMSSRLIPLTVRRRDGSALDSLAFATTSPKSGDESRDGVSLTNLDQSLFDGADATKRDLVEYLDAVRDRIIPELEDRPLSVI